jgi:transcriptional regulator GlxA family with amidase domain
MLPECGKRRIGQEGGEMDTGAARTGLRELPRICLLASRATSPSTLFGLYDVLSTAGIAFDELVSGRPGPPVLDVRIVAATCEPFRCVWDVLVEPACAIEDVAQIDAAVVCDMYIPVAESPRGRYPIETRWLRRMYEAGAIVSSVCSGSLVLADAGLLDGMETASHWAYRDMFREYFPQVTLREQDVLTISGEDSRIVTAGGVASWQDLALYLIARLCGQRHAIDAAKVHLLSSHDEGQLPYAALGLRPQKADAVIRECQLWIADNYICANPVSQMVERSGLNPRTFARRFIAASGYPPMEYVHSLRVEEAKQILETETLSVDEVGHHVGYEDPAYFHRLFKRKVGLTPARYRRKFAGIGKFAIPRAPLMGAGRALRT